MYRTPLIHFKEGNFEQILGNISGGRVLDVATGDGSFIERLKKSLKDYIEIVGVDTRNAANAVFEQKDINFFQMDAAHLTFDNESFDTVCISNSLHHFSSLSQVLAEAKRVLRAGGHYIISEMYRDSQKETQLTHVHLHHWWAEIDTALGITHNETYNRQQIIDIIGGLGVDAWTFYEYADLSKDPHDKKTIEEIMAGIDKYLQRAKDLPNYLSFEQQSRKLRQQLCQVGIQMATCLIAIGRKD
jgi:ubiquinone/menaquinone biosynthesis C-methylase UbiE